MTQPCQPRYESTALNNHEGTQSVTLSFAATRSNLTGPNAAAGGSSHWHGLSVLHYRYICISEQALGVMGDRCVDICKFRV